MRTKRAAMIMLGIVCLVLSGVASLAADPFTFSITCDQLGFGGSGTYDTPQYFRGVCEAIKALGEGAFMISPGDTYPPASMRWTIDQYIGASYVWYPAVGNHEQDAGTMAWFRTYNANGNTLPNVVNVGPPNCVETMYSFDYANCHFVIINEYFDGVSDYAADGDVLDPVYNWLVADLNATTKQHIFVIGHEPAYVQPDADNGRLRHLGDSLDGHPANRDRFVNLLKSKNVLAYMVGHTHNYSVVNIDGLWHVDAGHARGLGDTGAKSTFIMVHVNGGTVTYDTYRDNYNGGPYTLQHSGTLRSDEPPTPTELILAGATWKYLDNGSDQGTAWTAVSFDDAAWLSGPAELGYGDGDEATAVSYGPDSNNKYITTYFRNSFSVVDKTKYSALTLEVIRDDGVVVYLNGQEVFRNNLPAGTIAYTTLAPSAIGGSDESAWVPAAIDPSFLVNGTNVVAVEMHQNAGTSTDLSFNLKLSGTVVGQPVNVAPTVNAGGDQIITLPASASLDGTVSDDGLPNPPGTVTTSWSMVSGPAAVTFGNAAAVDTTASFTQAGTYVLRLTASDYLLTATDDVQIVVNPLAGQVTLVAAGSTWKYLDNGTDQGSAYAAPSYDDSSWASGAARLGYGGDGEVTTIGYGPDSGNKYVTSYFRHTFTVADASDIWALSLDVTRDDGAIVYLNGTEVFRTNMPATSDYLTYSSGVIGGAEETTWYNTSVAPNLLVSGDNVLAAEVHQCNAGSSDLGFDLRLLASSGTPINTAPVVNAGLDKTITLPADTLTIVGTATDDGFPNPPGALTVTWSQEGGTGTVTFDNANALSTTATFPGEGTYVLRLTASDSELSASDDVQVKVNPPASGGGWTAYNDCVYSSSIAEHYIAPNVTTYSIGSGAPGPAAGLLKDFTSGTDTPATVTLTEVGGVVWQPDVANNYGGKDCDAGTDAYDTFGGIADMHGVIYYGSSGWYVDATFTGLNPDASYEFATSANRDNASYTTRYSIYTITGADSFTNASTPGATILSPDSVEIWTGNNTPTGHVARWSEIKAGADGTFSVRVTHSSRATNAYAFDVFMLKETPPPVVGWSAYNDCVHRSDHNYLAANVTTFNIGNSSPGPASGVLKNFETGEDLPVTATLTEVGGVNWQPDLTTGGSDCAAGTDAFDTFGNIASMQGVTYYGGSGWYVDVTFTGLDPGATYEFATSANRNDSRYTNRISVFTIMGADVATNASTTGVTVISDESVEFCTGDNTATGYVARWTGINPGADGSFYVRATHSTVSTQAYAFDVFLLKQTGGTPPPPVNKAPVVDAGTDQTITLPASATLSGTATDDGLPTPPALTLQWSKTSGPGNVAFADASAASTTATFDAPGTYVLELTASDGLLSTSDEVTITVNPEPVVVAGWVAYNDCVYRSDHTPNAPNTTTFSIGNSAPGPASGALKDFTTGDDLPVTATLTQNTAVGSVNWQPDLSTGGSDCAAGTDASTTFGGIVGMQGVTYYGGTGWWVDITFTGLNPAASYEFATSANRNSSSYPTRISIFTIMGADAAANASTAGVTVISNESVSFCTGDNTANGYVARWTDIKCGADGSFTVRVTHDANAESGYKAYAFDVFMLKEVPPPVIGWSAYNDCVYRSDHVANAPNTTTFNIGNSSPGPASGVLKDFSTGDDLPVTATLTQNTAVGSVNWQPDLSSGGSDCAAGTDAFTTFGGIVGMQGVTYYGGTGWWVDVTFTGLDPGATYEFATSANRNSSSYQTRISVFTIMGADSANNASTAGVTVISNESVSFCTGDNTANGYVARWTGISCGADGSFTVRVTHDANAESGYKAYAFDVFMLKQSGGAPPVNRAPVVNAGDDQTITMPASATLSGTATDDGLPAPPALTLQWSKTSGPGNVTFADASAASTTATFDAPGTYVLKLTANDGLLSGSDEMTVTVNAAPLGNWVAYNDFGGTSDGNTTAFTVGGTLSGALKDYATGMGTGVTLTVTNSGAASDGGNGAGPAAGSPADGVFGSALNLVGYMWYSSVPSSCTVTLTGLNPAKDYTIAFYGNRNNESYTTRYTLFTISDYASFRHASSAGVATGGDSASCLTGINPDKVVAFKASSGPDGDLLITITGDQGTINAGDGKWYVNGMKVSQTDPLWPIPGDANGDCIVNICDLMFVRDRLMQDPASGDNAKADINEDGRINVLDLLKVRAQLGNKCQTITIENPYAGVTWSTFTQHKGNLHTHTTQSDGAMSPATVIDEYNSRGYTVLALTDHDTVTYPWQAYGRDPAALGMVDIQGNELSSAHHMGSWFCDYASTSGDNNALVAGVGQKNGIAVFYHPGRYSYTPDWYANFYRTYSHLIGMEVYNQGDRYPNDRQKWDAVLGLLMPDRPVWGFANDDMHTISHLGYNFNMLLLPSLCQAEVRSALTGGRFYFTHLAVLTATAPVIDSIVVDDQAATITIAGRNFSQIKWISNGQIVHTGVTLDCANTPNIGSYVRAELHGTNAISYTNPFGIRE